MEELISMRHMESAETATDNVFYRPHLAVVKNTRHTTKLPVVSNASMSQHLGIHCTTYSREAPAIARSIFYFPFRLFLRSQFWNQIRYRKDVPASLKRNVLKKFSNHKVNKLVHIRSTIARLRSYLDSNRSLSVGERFKSATLSDDVKHPTI